VIDWYKLSLYDILKEFETNAEAGLDADEAARRMAIHGPNELIERGRKNPWQILWEQLTAIMVVILIVAAIISAALGDAEDSIAILAIVVINALLGFRQEYRAEKAMQALKKLAVPIVKVRRSGHVREISSREIIPGDIVVLEAGNVVPADCRLMESINMRIQEAALTGESQAVEKVAYSLGDADLPLGDRRNMAYMGTVVTYGRGLAVVVSTGMKTELGSIAEMIQSVEREPTPLQRRMAQLGTTLAWAALAIVVVVFTLGVLRGEGVELMFLTAVSMAVAAVPEGLPAVVTIALAIGAQRILKKHALIRKLPAVETLGSVTVICSDKTGTLTENRMAVTVVDVGSHQLHFSEEMRRTGIDVQLEENELELLREQPALALIAAGTALCNDALLEFEAGKATRFQIVGDPTEGALLVATARLGLTRQNLERAFPRIAEVPFDSERKRMTTIHRIPPSETQIPRAIAEVWNSNSSAANGTFISFTKGAVDSLLDACSSVQFQDEIQPLTEKWKQRIESGNERLASEGMRVLGVAYRRMPTLPAVTDPMTIEQDLVFVGMIGMIDPARPEVKQAVQTCRTAGIRPMMITGDHPLTAQYIARNLSISDGNITLTGRELENMSLEELETAVEKVAVYARVAPEHKLRIVQALQNRGHIVAMTGDGVNDAPALKKADIGVAMGITGTDVSKEAADMVLQDDNFATIVAAVEQGRVIYDNIRKFLKYILASNFGEILVMLLAPFLGMPLPLLPLQILWINLVTDGLPGLAISLEPAERDTMRRPPYPPAESIFGRGVGRQIIFGGILIGMLSLLTGFWYWKARQASWQTMVFTTLTFAQMANILALRSDRASLFSIGLFSNKPLLGAVLLTIALQFMVIYLPLFQKLFNTVSLSAFDVLITIVLSTIIFAGVELEKRLRNRR
jgi:Ca2+-transporting ATPase